MIRALQENKADAAGIADATWQQQRAIRAFDPETIVSLWVTPGYCHCNFTALPDFDGLWRKNGPRRYSAWTIPILAGVQPWIWKTSHAGNLVKKTDTRL